MMIWRRVGNYEIEEKECSKLENFKIIHCSEFVVKGSKAGPHIYGMGSKVIATFNSFDDAIRYAEELTYLDEQKSIGYKQQEKQVKKQSISREKWDSHVADCYNDWNRAHGYR